jgi:hypothetical protein
MGGSGFPAAICPAGVKAIRGWKAAPTIDKLLTIALYKPFFATLCRKHSSIHPQKDIPCIHQNEILNAYSF